jgi:hypothetical protein
VSHLRGAAAGAALEDGIGDLGLARRITACTVWVDAADDATRANAGIDSVSRAG